MAVSLKVGGAFQHFAVQIEQQKQLIQTLESALDAANKENARLQIECGPSARQALLEEVCSSSKSRPSLAVARALSDVCRSCE